jgi:hypothetical protein
MEQKSKSEIEAEAWARYLRAIEPSRKKMKEAYDDYDQRMNQILKDFEDIRAQARREYLRAVGRDKEDQNE